MRFAFVSGNPALDLVATVESRRSKPVELLAGAADLEQWVRECGELPDDVTADAATFASTLELREAIYQLALDRLRNRRFTRASLGVVNDAARAPTPTVELSDAGVLVSGDLRSALAHVARRGVGVLADRDASLKECGREGCTRLYLDRSRGTRRTWCGMKECGDRVKAAAYRARTRAAHQGDGTVRSLRG